MNFTPKPNSQKKNVKKFSGFSVDDQYLFFCSLTFGSQFAIEIFYAQTNVLLQEFFLFFLAFNQVELVWLWNFNEFVIAATGNPEKKNKYRSNEQ